MSLSLILLIILILILVGALPTWGHSKNWGYGPSGGLGLVVVVLDRAAADGPHIEQVSHVFVKEGHATRVTFFYVRLPSAGLSWFSLRPCLIQPLDAHRLRRAQFLRKKTDPKFFQQPAKLLHASHP